MAAPRRSTRRTDLSERKQQNKTQQTLLIAIIAIVGAFGLLITITLMKDGDPKPPPGTAAATTGTETASAATGTGARRDEPPAGADPLRAKVEQFLRASQEGDVEAITRCVSFPRMNDALVEAGRREKRWNELDALAQTLERQEISKSLVADEATREFLRSATIRSWVVMEQDEKHAKVQVIQRHLVETSREQERVFELVSVDGAWFVAGMTASAVQTPEEMQRVADAERAAEKAKRANLGLAPIEKQENLADTPADVQSKIDALCTTLTDTSATREVSKAKRELAAIGKPAIPALLNLIVGREELATPADQIVINNAVSALKDITLEDFGFAPGGIGGSMSGDIKDENVKSLMRWFGWWKKHKAAWTGPRIPEDGS